MEEIVKQYKEVIDLITPILGKKKAKLWITAPNPLLGDVTPAEMLTLGRFEKLKKFINTQIAENG